MSETVLVLGFGVTGKAVAEHQRGAGKAVAVVDDHPSEQSVEHAQALGVELIAVPPREGFWEQLVSASTYVVPSPGVAPSHPALVAALNSGIPVFSEIELAYLELERQARPKKLVAITGTNGKTTVTSLVTKMLEASAVGAVAAGNIGVPLLEAVSSDAQVVVAEISSFQLQFTQRFHPHVSCWLNLSADHLDWHGSQGSYVSAKEKIWANQGPGDAAVVNCDDPTVMAASTQLPGGVKLITFGSQADADWKTTSQGVLGPDGMFASAEKMFRSLPHDISNAAAALAIVREVGAEADAAVKTLETTPPPAHRIELVVERDGVRWFDDSKATTPASVIAAVAGFESVVLLAGGRNKGLDLRVLASCVPPVRYVVAFGEAADEVRAAMAHKVPVTLVETMEQAVAEASRVAERGDVVLLSPGCTSLDMYRSYAQRGEHFASLARQVEVVGNADRGEPAC